MEPNAALTLNLLLRGATIGVLVLIAAALWRDQRQRAAGRLGAAFALGVAAATLAAMPGFDSVAAAWRAPVAALATASMFVFWLFTRALLDDDFRWRAWQLGAWVLLAGVGALHCLGFAPQARVLDVVTGLLPVGFALIVIAQSLASWRADLVEQRRHLRTLIVAATALYTVAQLAAAIVSGHGLRAVVESPANAAGTALLVGLIGWQLIHVPAGELFAPDAPPPAATVAPVPRPDARQVATLERLMRTEHVYREPSLTVAALAARMGLPEHRLRRLINQGLGHRNFNSFLNGYRIEDAKQALADPAAVAVPVLTIAMNAGFQSVGPFNRAFKAATGATPSEYRRTAAAVGEPAPADCRSVETA